MAVTIDVVLDEHVVGIAAAGEVVVADADVAVLDEDGAAAHVARVGVVAGVFGSVEAGGGWSRCAR